MMPMQYIYLLIFCQDI